jgi:hypothetical protein
MAWVHPNTVFRHYPIFGKKTEDLTPVKSPTAPSEAFEVIEKTSPQEFLAAFKRDELQRVNDWLKQRAVDWLNELARALEGRPATLARKKFGSAEGGSRLHGSASALASASGISAPVIAAVPPDAGALADASPAAPEARAPVGDHDAGAAKPQAFTADDIEQLRTILTPVQDRISFELTMKKWANLAREDRQEFADLTQTMKRGRGRPKDEAGYLAALWLAAI